MKNTKIVKQIIHKDDNMDKHYIKRVIDKDLEKYLKIIGVVLIVGPK